jgi:hypothetical protein
MVVLGAMIAFEEVVSTCASCPPLSAGPNGVIALGLRSVRFPVHPVPFRSGRNSGRPHPPQGALTARQALWAHTAYQPHPSRTCAGTPPARQPGDRLTGTCPLTMARWPSPGCSGSPTAAPAPPPFAARLSVAPFLLCALSGGCVSRGWAWWRAAVCARRPRLGARYAGA